MGWGCVLLWLRGRGDIISSTEFITPHNHIQLPESTSNTHFIPYLILSLLFCIRILSHEVLIDSNRVILGLTSHSIASMSLRQRPIGKRQQAEGASRHNLENNNDDEGMPYPRVPYKVNSSGRQCMLDRRRGPIINYDKLREEVSMSPKY